MATHHIHRSLHRILYKYRMEKKWEAECVFNKTTKKDGRCQFISHNPLEALTILSLTWKLEGWNKEILSMQNNNAFGVMVCIFNFKNFLPTSNHLLFITIKSSYNSWCHYAYFKWLYITFLHGFHTTVFKFKPFHCYKLNVIPYFAQVSRYNQSSL